MASPNRQVLVIDDEPRIRGFVTRALSSAGLTVSEAATGPEGLTAALSDHPDLVLLDLTLPGLSGEHVPRHLQCQLPGQPVLVWSATADADAEGRCLTLGASQALGSATAVGLLWERLRGAASHRRRAGHESPRAPRLAWNHRSHRYQVR